MCSSSSPPPSAEISIWWASWSRSAWPKKDCSTSSRSFRCGATLLCLKNSTQIPNLRSEIRSWWCRKEPFVGYLCSRGSACSLHSGFWTLGLKSEHTHTVNGPIFTESRKFEWKNHGYDLYRWVTNFGTACWAQLAESKSKQHWSDLMEADRTKLTLRISWSSQCRRQSWSIGSIRLALSERWKIFLMEIARRLEAELVAALGWPEWSLRTIEVLSLAVITVSLVQYTSDYTTSNSTKLSKGDVVKPSTEFRWFQLQYLSVYLILMLADWLQGTNMYTLYSSYGVNVGTLFLTGFLSSAVFGTFLGIYVDQWGRKLGCLIFCILEVSLVRCWAPIIYCLLRNLRCSSPRNWCEIFFELFYSCRSSSIWSSIFRTCLLWCSVDFSVDYPLRCSFQRLNLGWCQSTGSTECLLVIWVTTRHCVWYENRAWHFAEHPISKLIQIHTHNCINHCNTQ